MKLKKEPTKPKPENLKGDKPNHVKENTPKAARLPSQLPPQILKLNKIEYFKDIVNAIREPLLVLDADLRVLSANRSFYRFFKVKQKEIAGTLIYDLGNQQWDIPGLRELLETILPQKAVFNDYQVDHDFPNIGERAMLLNARRIPSPPKEAQLILLAFEDITEHKWVEQDLLYAKEYSENLIQTANVMVVGLDIAGKVIVYNQEAEKITGYTHAELLGKNWFETLVPKDQYPIVWEEFNRLLEVGVPRVFENPILTRSGEVRIISWQNSELREQGGITGTISFGIDITERKQAEEKQVQIYELLTNLARQVPGVIYQYRLYPDGSSAFPYSSPRMYSIYEVTSEEVQEDATPVFGRLHPEDYDRVTNSIFESARTLEEFYCEFRVILPQQGLRWRWSQAHPERTEDGGTLWHGIISDITEKKEAEKALNQSNEQLRLLSAYLQNAIETERTVIARELHDDFGQSMTALKMDLTWLVNRLPENDEKVERINKMTELVDDSISLMRRIASSLRPVMLDDLGLVATIQWQANGFSERTGILCDLDLPKEDLDFDLDLSTTLFRIFQECLTNISRHAHASQVNCSLKLLEQTLILTVQDDGVGINGSESYDRSSLGLLGMRERAAQWGGDLSIQGIPGKGTTLTVRIPLP